MTGKEKCLSVTLKPMLGSYGLGFHRENGRCFKVVFQNVEILVDDISNFEIERMII
jgi:hypothetical protein